MHAVWTQLHNFSYSTDCHNVHLNGLQEPMPTESIVLNMRKEYWQNLVFMDFFLHGNRRDKQIGDRRRIQKPHEEQVHSTVSYRIAVMQNIISHLTTILQSTMHHRTTVVHSTSPFW